MTDPITFVHLTDLHISHPESGDTTLLVDTLSVLDLALAEIGRMAPPPAFVVVSGDLTNRGDEASYEIVNDRLKALGLPVFLALGNHDDREAFAAIVLGKRDGPAPPFFYDFFDPELADVHVIVLDTLIPGKVRGTIDDAQFAFLAEALERHAERAKLIVMHHPPQLDDSVRFGWENIDHAATEKLAEAIAGHNVAAILCGHIHHNRVSNWHGVPVVIPTGHHNTIDPLFRDGLRIMEAAGFAVCTLRPSGLTASLVALPVGRRELAVVPSEVVENLD